jgi:hypothetical protein
VSDPTPVVCSTCSDSHRMTLGEREVPCTFCPRPCESCRSLYQGQRLGAYCEATPCLCACHPTPEQLTGDRLAETLVGLLSYRPGVATFPRDRSIVEAEVGCLPIAARLYLARGAWHIHRRIEALQNTARQACPCLHVEPCDPDCTCVKPFMSRGCTRCCTYGSKEQQVEAARYLVGLSSSRKKALEEAAKIADEEREPTGPMDPALYLATSMRPEIAVRAAISSTKACIAKKIRALAKEFPK